MRDKKCRDSYREEGNAVISIHNKELQELLTIADERDSLQAMYDIGVSFHDLKCAELQVAWHQYDTLEAKYRHLEAKLMEAEKDLREIEGIRGIQTIDDQLLADRVEELEAKLSRFSVTVPEDIHKKLEDILTIPAVVESSEEVQSAVDLCNDFLALIGSLIETNREKLRGMLEGAWLDGVETGGYSTDHNAVTRAAKAYAQKKIEEMGE